MRRAWRRVTQAGAMIDDVAAVDDQALELAGGSILGGPRTELGPVMGQEVGHELGVEAVVFGTTNDKGLAELLEADGIDGVEGDPIVAAQEADEVVGGLLENDGDPVLGEALTQVGGPGLEGGRIGGEGGGILLLGLEVQEMEVDLAVGSIHADHQVEGRCWSCHIGVL